MSVATLKKSLVEARKTLKSTKDSLKKIVEGPFKGTPAKKKTAANKRKKIKDTEKRIKELQAKLRKETPKPKGKATQKGLRMKRDYEVQEGMGLDPITGRGVKAASDVDKGKAGKVTRSPEPGFLQQQRTAGSRARAERKVEASQEKRTAKTKVERKRAARREEAMEAKDVRDTMSATAKAADTRKATAAKKRKEVDHFAVAINRKTGVINEESFKELTPNQQKLLIQDIKARFAGPKARQILAEIEELSPSKPGDSAIRRRSGIKGMSGATERNVKDIDEGVSRGRGGLDFKKGGDVKKLSDQELMDNYKQEYLKKLIKKLGPSAARKRFSEMEERGMFNKGGAAKKKKKVPVVTIGIGMMAAPKGKKSRTGNADFRNGGMVMSSTNNLKPVPSGNKGKGLRALPKPVRNNMGFMKKGGMVKK